jgi:cell division GTPase FtsZ
MSEAQDWSPFELCRATDGPEGSEDRSTAVIRAITFLVTYPPNLIGFDISDFRAVFIDGGRAVFGEGEAEGPDRAIRAADAAIADIRRQLRDGERV